jgi:response regulator NasT
VKPLDIQQIIPSIKTALLRGQEIQKLHQTEINLSTALKTSRDISTAIGLCMERFGVGADESFDALRTYCRSNRKKLVDVADQIIKNKNGVDLTPYLSSKSKM